MNNKKILSLLLSLLLSLGMLVGCSSSDTEETTSKSDTQVEETLSAVEETAEEEKDIEAPVVETEDATLATTNQSFSLDMVPSFSGAAYVAVNGNVPFFTQAELSAQAYEKYASLDYLGRCGVAVACIDQSMMPTEERGSIGQVKPSGWHTVKYDNVDGKYLYNRCHLIGHQLTGEDANKQNLITGTRYLNIEGMLPFENMVADYVKETGNHVMYRVTPIFEDNNLVASGVLMEGYSVEDNGAGISYCVYAYNAQPGLTIDYASGDSQAEGGATQETVQATTATTGQSEAQTYILNTNNKKFHYPSCRHVAQMKNPVETTTTRNALINQGYDPCGTCKP